MNYKIGVVIACYKVRKHILSVISNIGDEVSLIYAVDDCCPEESGLFIQTYCHDPRVRVIRNQKNLGVGGSLKIGYWAAIAEGVDVIVKIDGDGQMDPAYILPLIAPILAGKADYVKGNRFLHEMELKQMPLLRRVGNLGLSFLTKLASGYWNIFDPTNGYTALRASVIPLLNVNRIDNRYFFESSMLIELGLHRAVVKDISIPSRYGNEQSSLSELRSLFEFPPKLFRGLIRRIIYLYFIRDFMAVSLFLITGFISVIFGVIWGLRHWILSYLTGIEASTGTVMIAVLPIIIGLQLLLQAIVLDIQNVPYEIINSE